MKRLAALLTFAPSLALALAHGAHVEMPAAAHDFVHATPVILAVALITVVVAVWRARV